MPRRPYKPLPLPEVTVSDEYGLVDAVAHLRDSPILGFDIEFVGEDTYRPDLCLIQVSTAERLMVIDPFTCGPLDAFWALLHDPNRVLVVHAGREEVRMCRFASGRPPANLFDVQIAAGLVGMTYPIGYAGAVQEILGVRLSKGDTLTDWRRRPLSASQIRYAFDDVRYLLPIHAKLTARLSKRNRLPWAAEEFAAFIRRATGDEVTVERWRKIKGIGALNRRELAVVRAVFGWREGIAERQNRPARSVMRDDLLIEVARRGSRNADELQHLRGMPRYDMAGVLAAVRSAAELPPSELPERMVGEIDPPQVGTLSALLSVVLADLCEHRKLAPNLVCSQQDLKDLVRARLPGHRLPDDSPFAAGWRAEAIRTPLEEVLDGRTSLRVADPRSADPLEYLAEDDEAEEEEE